METTKVALLRNAMQTYNLRMQATASNLANLDTPGYQRMSVSFEEQLQDALHGVASPRQAHEVQARMQVEDEAPILEDELMEMADTQMRTQLTTRALREHFELTRMGILGRAG